MQKQLKPNHPGKRLVKRARPVFRDLVLVAESRGENTSSLGKSEPWMASLRSIGQVTRPG